MSLRALAQQSLVFLAQGTSNWQFYSRLFSEHHLSWMPEIEVAAAAQVMPVGKHEPGIGFLPSWRKTP